MSETATSRVEAPSESPITEVHRLLAEHHHQIGSSFQTLISFIRLRMNNRETVPCSDLEAVTFYLTLLASVHSNIAEKVRKGALGSNIPFEIVLSELLDDWTSRAPELELTWRLDTYAHTAKEILGIGAVIVALLSSRLTRSCKSVNCSFDVSEQSSPQFCITLRLTHPDNLSSEVLSQDGNFALAHALCASKGARRLSVQVTSPSTATVALSY
jgi:hypothetical protein